MKKIINKKILITIVLLFSFLIFGTVLAAGDYGLEATRSAAGLNKGEIPTIIGNAIGAILSMIGVLFFGLMLYAGILWMVARGNQEQEKKALNTITAAIIGIIIVVASYAITNFVFEQVLQGKSVDVGGEKTDCEKEKGTEGYACQGLTACGIEGEYKDLGVGPGDNWIKNKCPVASEICCKGATKTGKCVVDKEKVNLANDLFETCSQSFPVSEDPDGAFCKESNMYSMGLCGDLSPASICGSKKLCEWSNDKFETGCSAKPSAPADYCDAYDTPETCPEDCKWEE